MPALVIAGGGGPGLVLKFTLTRAVGRDANAKPEHSPLPRQRSFVMGRSSKRTIVISGSPLRRIYREM